MMSCPSLPCPTPRRSALRRSGQCTHPAANLTPWRLLLSPPLLGVSSPPPLLHTDRGPAYPCTQDYTVAPRIIRYTGLYSATLYYAVLHTIMQCHTGLFSARQDYTVPLVIIAPSAHESPTTRDYIMLLLCPEVIPINPQVSPVPRSHPL